MSNTTRPTCPGIPDYPPCGACPLLLVDPSDKWSDPPETCRLEFSDAVKRETIPRTLNFPKQ